MAVPHDDDGKLSTKQNNVAFAKLLAGNDKKLRDKGLKKLKKWLSVRSLSNFDFTENDLMTIWVGLYYSMWMSDMPLIQEELAESMSSLIHCFNKNTDAALLFIKCFNATVNRSWAGLDQHRVDKFSMLVRRFLRQSLVWLSENEWRLSLIRKLMGIYSDEVLAERVSLGFKLHFIDIFLEEVAKVAKGDLPPLAVMALVTPFFRTAATTKEGRVRLQLDVFFRHLIKQTDVALEYEDKFQAWKKAGFPGGDLRLVVPDTDDVVDEDSDEEKMTNGSRKVDTEAYEENETSDEDDDQIENEKGSSKNEQPLDPRAGSVHVMLPQIQLPVKFIVKLAKQLTTLPEASIKGKRMMLAISRQFRKLEKGQYPFAVGKVADDEKFNMNKLVDTAAKKMVKSELMRKKKSKKSQLKKKKNVIGLPNDPSEISNDKRDDSKSAKLGKFEKSGSNQLNPKRRRSVEKMCQKIETTTISRKRKASTAFTVSQVPEKKEKVGKQNAVITELSTELELPPGWIVEACEETPRPKKPALLSWQVNQLENGPKRTQLKDVINNSVVTSLINITPEKKEAPNSPVKRNSPKRNLSFDGEKVLLTSPIKENEENTSPKEKFCDAEKVNTVKEEEPMEEEASQSKEVEIIIRNKEKSPLNPPAFFSKAFAKAGVSPKKSILLNQISEMSSPRSGRRISFNLARNMAQEKVEYFEQVQRSPQIPFDGARKPKISALKAGLPPSPINPFYALKLNLNHSIS